MAKEKEPKCLCWCGCGKMLSEGAEHCHRDGKVPPCIAAVQKSQTRVKAGISKLQSFNRTASLTSTAAQEDIGMDENSNRVPSPISDSNAAILQDLEPEVPVMVPEETMMTQTAINPSVKNARAAVWTEWQAQRENATVLNDEEDENTQDDGHKNSDDDELDGLVMPEDDEDNEYDSQSVDDWIEAEWEKEWAELGVLYLLCWFFFPSNLY